MFNYYSSKLNKIYLLQNKINDKFTLQKIISEVKEPRLKLREDPRKYLEEILPLGCGLSAQQYTFLKSRRQR